MSENGLIKTFEGHSDGVLCTAFSPCGKILATGSEDNTIKIWSLPEGANTPTIAAQEGNVHGLSFSPDCSLLASAGWGKVVKIWKVSDGSLVKTLSGHDSCVNRVCFSPDGKTLATSSNDASLKLWDTGGELLRTLKPNIGDIKALAFSPDGSMLALGGVGLQFFSSKELVLLKDNDNYVYGVRDLAFSNDGKLLAAALGMEKKMEIWSLETMSLSGTIKDSDWLNCAAFFPGGKSAVTGGTAIKMWDTQNGTLTKTLEGHTDEIYSVCVSPDGQYIASASNDKTVKLWKA
jgi:WD40 repeat protein